MGHIFSAVQGVRFFQSTANYVKKENKNCNFVRLTIGQKMFNLLCEVDFVFI